MSIYRCKDGALMRYCLAWSLLLSTLLLAGCAPGSGGLYSASAYSRAPLVQVGMTAAQVQQRMGPSWDTMSTAQGLEIWRYSWNIFGLYGPSCRTSVRRGTAMGCMSVFFKNGVVFDVAHY